MNTRCFRFIPPASFTATQTVPLNSSVGGDAKGKHQVLSPPGLHSAPAIRQAVCKLSALAQR